MQQPYIYLAKKFTEQAPVELLLGPLIRIVKILHLTMQHQKLEKRYIGELSVIFFGFIFGLALAIGYPPFLKWINSVLPFTEGNLFASLAAIWLTTYPPDLLYQGIAVIVLIQKYKDDKYYLSSDRERELITKLNGKVQMRQNKELRLLIREVFNYIRDLKHGALPPRHPASINVEDALNIFMYGTISDACRAFNIFYLYYQADLLADNHELITNDAVLMESMAAEFTSPMGQAITANEVKEAFKYLSRCMQDPENQEAVDTVVKMLDPTSDKLKTLSRFVLSLLRVSDENQNRDRILEQYAEYNDILHRLRSMVNSTGGSSPKIAEPGSADDPNNSPPGSINEENTGKLSSGGSEFENDPERSPRGKDRKSPSIQELERVFRFLGVDGSNALSLTQEQIETYQNIIEKSRSNYLRENKPSTFILEQLAAKVPLPENIVDKGQQQTSELPPINLAATDVSTRRMSDTPLANTLPTIQERPPRRSSDMMKHRIDNRPQLAYDGAASTVASSANALPASQLHPAHAHHAEQSGSDLQATDTTFLGRRPPRIDTKKHSSDAKPDVASHIFSTHRREQLAHSPSTAPVKPRALSSAKELHDTKRKLEERLEKIRGELENIARSDSAERSPGHPSHEARLLQHARTDTPDLDKARRERGSSGLDHFLAGMMGQSARVQRHKTAPATASSAAHGQEDSPKPKRTPPPPGI